MSQYPSHPPPPVPRGSTATPNRQQQQHDQQHQYIYGQQPNYGSLERNRRRSGGGGGGATSAATQSASGRGSASARMSPGPSIYRTMPLQTPPTSGSRSVTPSGGGGGRHTPSHMIRPIPQHLGGGPGGVPYSPVTVPKMSQSPVIKQIGLVWSQMNLINLLISGPFPCAVLSDHPFSVHPQQQRRLPLRFERRSSSRETLYLRLPTWRRDHAQLGQPGDG